MFLVLREPQQKYLGLNVLWPSLVHFLWPFIPGGLSLGLFSGGFPQNKGPTAAPPSSAQPHQCSGSSGSGPGLIRTQRCLCQSQQQNCYGCIGQKQALTPQMTVLLPSCAERASQWEEGTLLREGDTPDSFIYFTLKELELSVWALSFPSCELEKSNKFTLKRRFFSPFIF